MKIVPKIADCDYVHRESERYYNGYSTIEIQMLGDSISESFDRCKKLFDKCIDTTHFILHVPLKCVDFLTIVSNRVLYSEFVQMLVECIEISENRGYRIDILVHNKCVVKEFQLKNGDSKLNALLKIIEGTNVYFLFENSIVNFLEFLEPISADDYVFSNYKSDHLNYNLDICHLQASENKHNLAIDVPDSIKRRVTNIHFSKTKDHDGFTLSRQNETHSQPHDGIEDCLEDIEYIKSKGIDIENLLLVTEIIESDYVNRPCMEHEINCLKKILDENYVI